MLLSELFDRLALGELSQHRYGKTGAILEKDYPALIHQVNMALNKLHVLFPLKESEVILRQYEAVTVYELCSDYAVSNTSSTADTQYIVDSSVNPFLDDVVRIEAVFDGEGNEVPLNDDNLNTSWFTPTWDSLQIPEPVEGNISILVYRAKHAVIATDAVPTSTELIIPPCLEEALQATIASRCFVSLGDQTSASLSSYYSNVFERQVSLVERSNLLQSSAGDSNIKLMLKGFI